MEFIDRFWAGLLLVCLECGVQGCGARAPEPPVLEPLTLSTDGEWIRDAGGRVVILRGANYSGLEFGNFIGAPSGPEDADFETMAGWGLTVIRLPIAWSYLEPEPGTFDETFLGAQVDPVIALAEAHGIRVIPEMHQYSWSVCTGGNGAPAWICEGHDYPEGFQGPLQAGCDFFQGALAPDGEPLLDHYVAVWRLVARHYAGDNRVIGFDFFNEPNAMGCLTTGEFEQQVLHPLYRRLDQAAREEGALQPRFYTPSMARNTGARIPTESLGSNWVYAPHLYTTTYGQPDLKYTGDRDAITADYAQALEEAAGLQGPLWAAEFGGSTVEQDGFREATAAFLEDSLDEQDRRLVGGAVWAFFPSDNTFSLVDAQGQEKPLLVDALIRPGARRIAGIPTRLLYDELENIFLVDFEDDPSREIKDPTEIFVPARRYPGGFVVEVEGDDLYEILPGGERILHYRGSVGAHRLRVLPRP